MKTSPTHPSNCTRCGLELDAATHHADATPNPGDVTICIHCHGVSAFSPDLTLVPIDERSLPDDVRREVRRRREAMRKAWTP